MKHVSTYSVKIKDYRRVFKDTVSAYRQAVDYFIAVADKEWASFQEVSSSMYRLRLMEEFAHRTAKRPSPKYCFEEAGKVFYKFPSYLRRAAINEALGKVSSYRSNLDNWEQSDVNLRGKPPACPRAGFIYPVLYRENMYKQSGECKAAIKVFVNGTWNWITVSLNKGDVDYIKHHCADSKECAPTLQKRGKEWFLDFPFEREIELKKVEPYAQRIVAVDLGINNACVCSVMASDGTVMGREILTLSREKDRLNHCIGRIKKAQQHGNKRTPRLWASAKGINRHIAERTATFILSVARQYEAEVIVFEYLELKGKKRGSKKQRLHLWKARDVQTIVTHKAHVYGMRISRVNAWNTSRLAFYGSGRVERGVYEQNGEVKYNYSICVFPTGKTYNCDLNASYNIGARYYIREILKSLPETVRLDTQAKVPECTKRSTCTLSTLISLHTAMCA
ncbi:IS605 OrfB family transposase [Lachnospiraceae bacterium PM6-15]|uniref:IS200/IS605 family accessory protein TnpB-related protein n=1 Tax=Ohessyouella blattaphilus TaxID=2949333 RepID=UPI003E1844EF